MEARRLQIAIVGPGDPSDRVSTLARKLGAALARGGVVIWTGGRGGAMESACRGAREAGGRTVGVLPGASAEESAPNPHVETAVFTGMGQARNLVLVLSVDVVVAVGGSWGTLTEIAMARKHGRPVVLLESWGLEAPAGDPDPGVRVVHTVEEAVRAAMELGRRIRQEGTGT